jgi:hypothetical protein
MGTTTYINQGQVASFGEGAQAYNNTLHQIVTDLSRLHEHMAANSNTPEQQSATDDIAKARQAAQEQDEVKMRQHLQNAGKWVLDCAKEIGTEVTAEYLKKLTLGL